MAVDSLAYAAVAYWIRTAPSDVMGYGVRATFDGMEYVVGVARSDNPVAGRRHAFRVEMHFGLLAALDRPYQDME